MKKPRIQKIRIVGRRQRFVFGGWLGGRSTYLRIEDPATGQIDWLEGYALYRLAKAIVRRWEASK